jgi:serine/threonine protein kinase
MAVRIESQAEPIPGYRLLERLGGGGFGEVWKAEAPGGLLKAIKFVYGDLQAADEDGVRAVQELKGLNRVKTVQHPYILSLERVDILDGQLVIVMELAHRTLWDRFKECRSEGLPGVPREELLRYLAETAEALDMMNQEYRLQHLDIKPQNIFLVHNHVKVADFGLVKDLEGVLASVTGGVTPVYAAPETFDGKVSRFSDQYSLAIVYQELLTGHRPFSGTTVRQLVLQHLQARPDLSSLPPHDRPVIARALAKGPDERYPLCLEFIRELRHGAGETPAVAAEGREPAAPPHTPPKEEPQQPTRSSQPSPGPAKAEIGPPAADGEAGGQAATARLAPAGPNGPDGTGPRAADPAPHPSEGPAALATTVNRPVRSLPAAPGTEVLVPALVLGLGGLGQTVLRQLRQEVRDHFGPGQALPQLRYLCLDTDPEAVAAATRGGEEAFRAGEVLLTRLQRPSYYVRAQTTPAGLDGWLSSRVLYRIPRQPMADGVRALGRLAFVSNYPAVARRLEAEVKACCDQRAWRQAAQQTGLEVVPAPRVYVVAGLAGGTGSGMFLDVAYVVKHLLKRLGFERPEVVGLLLLPEAEGAAARKPDLANAFAALAELHHFAGPRARFSARYHTGETHSNGGAAFGEVGPPFQRCVLLPAGAPPAGWESRATGVEPEAASASIARAGHLLFAELCTPLGRAAERLRRAPARPGEQGDALLYQTCGSRRVISPRRNLLARAARRVARRLIQRWTSKDARPVREATKQWVAQRWAELRLGTEDLITRLQEACEKKLKQAPEAKFAEVLAPALALAAPGRGKSDRNASPVDEDRLLAAVVEAMGRVEQLLGVPEECQPLASRSSDDTAPPAVVAEALKTSAASLADECELRLAQTVVRLIEEPAFRLVGAEEAIRQLNATVEQALRHQEQLAKELQERSVAVYTRIRELLDLRPVVAQSPTSSWKMPFSRKSSPVAVSAPVAELVELVRTYPKCRYQSLILQRVSAFYLGLRGQLSDQLVEVDFCRARLHELAALVGDPPNAPGSATPARAALPLPAEAATYLLPEGCPDLEEAIGRVDAAVSDQDLQALDRRMQELIQKQCRALVHVCMTTTHALRGLAPQLRHETESFLSAKVAGANVVEAYLEQDGDRREDLATLFAAAAPGLDVGAEDMCIVAAPPGVPGDQLRAQAQQALPETRLEPAASAEDEVVFYRERLFQTPLDLAPFLVPAREAYRQLLAQDGLTPHSRNDIKKW